MSFLYWKCLFFQKIGYKYMYYKIKESVVKSMCFIPEKLLVLIGHSMLMTNLFGALFMCTFTRT